MVKKSPRMVKLLLLLVFVLLYGCASTQHVSIIKPNKAPEELHAVLGDVPLTIGKEGRLSYTDPYVAPMYSASVYDILEKKLPRVYKKYLGKRYRLGANPDKSSRSDCSNLVSAVVRSCMNNTNYTFAPYYLTSRGIHSRTYKIDISEVKTGDVLTFHSRGGRINHTGIVTKKKNNTVYFVHASTSNGVTVTNTKSKIWKKYWLKRFHSFRRWKSSVFKTDHNMSTLYASAKKTPKRSSVSKSLTTNKKSSARKVTKKTKTRKSKAIVTAKLMTKEKKLSKKVAKRGSKKKSTLSVKNSKVKSTKSVSKKRNKNIKKVKTKGKVLVAKKTSSKKKVTSVKKSSSKKKIANAKKSLIASKKKVVKKKVAKSKKRSLVAKKKVGKKKSAS